jgi:hypothetical protein
LYWLFWTIFTSIPPKKVKKFPINTPSFGCQIWGFGGFEVKIVQNNKYKVVPEG